MKDNNCNLFDFGLKKGGKMPLFDNNSLDQDGNMIPFETQVAIVSHYILTKGSKFDKTYKKKAEKFIELWTEWINGKQKEYNICSDFVSEHSSLDLYLFHDIYNAPFKPIDTPKFSFIDLFAGIGGFRLAFQNVGGKCVFSSEWDNDAQRTYFANYGEYPFGDITLDSTKKYIPKNFDILCAGFPCQPFSYAGLKEGFEDKTRGTLFFEICKILSEHRPKMFLLENVKGLVSHKNGETIRIILESLRELRYSVHTAVLSSLDFGLPQKRERWYCVGFDKEIDFSFPMPSNTSPTLRDIVDIKDNNPSLKLSNFELERIDYHFAHVTPEQKRVPHDNSKYKPTTKKGKYGIFSYQKPDGSLRFHVGDVAKTQIQEAFYACLDTYAPTIIAGRVPKMWDMRRKLSVLESKRLQGFPDNFLMPVSDIQAYKQLGNSVSVPIIQAIAQNMISTYYKK